MPDKPDLAALVETVAAAAGDLRIRLGSLEPTVVTEDFCRRLAAVGKLCRHFHLSLQSGCDRTLKAMNRKYDTARFLQAVELLRRFFPGCGITGDLIVGFPGETEQDHARTLAFLRRCAFSDLHVFPYSRRPGTPADKLPGQCSRALKAARAREAQAEADRTRRAFLEQSVGQVLPVLFETEGDGCSVGHSDTYVLVKVSAPGLRGQTLPVRITAVEDERLTGELEP